MGGAHGKLADGTQVGVSAEGRAFAQAISRMHCIFRDCDAEFRELSDAINQHGRKSEEFTAAANKLQQCQQRRTTDFTAIEARCGPAQEAYRLCVQRVHSSVESDSAGAEHACLPVLHIFLDCAQAALDAKANT